MIRKAGPHDAIAIAEIYNHYIRESIATFEEQEVSHEIMVARMQRDAQYGFSWWVAEDDSNVQGYAYTTIWNKRSAYRFTAESTVYIRYGQTGSGWGSRLYNNLFQELKQKNVHQVIGGISLPNPASVALHEKFGMKKVAHFERVGFKFGRWVDVGYWQMSLDPVGTP